MHGLFLTVIALSHGYFHTAAHSSEEHYLWCYECNVDLTEGHKTDCNDPYTPGGFGLVACPRNESHHCHKSVILYKNVLVTVRTCVSSRKVNGYCNYENSFPHSSIECYFCKENACNDEMTLSPTSKWYLGLFAIVLCRTLM